MQTGGKRLFPSGRTEIRSQGVFHAMYLHRPHVNSIFLTPQEAMDLLDLCVISEAEADPDKKRIIGKLTAFVRSCIMDEQDARCNPAC
jgi:hypothetical protein